MRDGRGTAAMDDLVLLLFAVVGFSLFFASLATAFIAREDRESGERLDEAAERLLAAVLDDPRWTAGHGQLLPEGLDAATPEDFLGAAAGHPFRVVVWDLRTDARWTYEGGTTLGDRRVAATNANLVAGTVDPARVAATVWGS